MACKYKIDQRIMKDIVYSPLLFAKRTIKDNQDYISIRIPYFGMFTQKNATNKAKRLVRLHERIWRFAEATEVSEEDLVLTDTLATDGKYDELVVLAKRIGLKVR